MNISTLASARRGRWALSFADLLLLLLGFFVMLQASGQRRDAVLAQVRQQFGGHAGRPMEIRAAELFLPGEAVLTEQGRKRLKVVSDRFALGRERLEVSSRGTDAAHRRFDGWDLSAARLGAVARALKADGIGGDRLALRGLDQLDGEGGKGQVILIAAGR
ncbi:flagellar motor protein [Sphingobium indicum IP26]|uniref:flagellar motor protein MotB n=1 Tax=Sphingobium TaxID=165695 RepID=UPI000381722F|nr:flagellar motor protein MotB [Sphingobium sp. HDIP04]EPR12620.1 flagellar motor protein [Sphingobium indicum IP26]EQA97153.1 flagellar motor protein [Sphingobium sp. HDIP04]